MSNFRHSIMSNIACLDCKQRAMNNRGYSVLGLNHFVQKGIISSQPDRQTLNHDHDIMKLVCDGNGDVERRGTKLRGLFGNQPFGSKILFVSICSGDGSRISCGGFQPHWWGTNLGRGRFSVNMNVKM